MRVTPFKEIPIEDSALVSRHKGVLFTEKSTRRGVADGCKISVKIPADKFYNIYSAEKYPEIEHKPDRPYMVFLVEIDGNTYAIPFRTNVKHKWCYKFKNTTRNTKCSTGLDYSKAVVVNDKAYIGKEATIDNKEYVELNNKYYFIIKKFHGYLQGYVKYIKDGTNEFDAKKYKFSTLQYFHKELGLIE